MSPFDVPPFMMSSAVIMITREVAVVATVSDAVVVVVVRKIRAYVWFMVVHVWSMVVSPIVPVRHDYHFDRSYYLKWFITGSVESGYLSCSPICKWSSAIRPTVRHDRCKDIRFLL